MLPRKKNGRSFCLFFLTALAAAMLDGAEIRGTVKDIYDQPLAGVHILIGASGRSVDSDERGEFSFSADGISTVLQLVFESPRHYREKMSVSLNGHPRNLKIFLIPLRLLKEDITVTALNESEKALSVPFAQNVVSRLEIAENQPETIVQAIQNSPGVSFIGKGGVSVTPSIRGLARRRILLLVGGARITSDRSAGASAQFFPPELVQRIEVVRSAASVIYGSDAIGGVIQIIPRDAQDPGSPLAALNLSGNSANQKVNGGLAIENKFGPLSLRAAVQISRAGDYSSRAARVLNSGFNYYTGNLVVAYETKQRAISFNFLRSAGRDVGKPERANDPAVSSFYPEENTNLLNIAYHDNSLVANGSLNFSLFLNPNDYELDKIKHASRQVDIAKNKALDFGGRAFLRKALNGQLSYQFGVDYYGRAGVDMENETWKNGLFDGASRPVSKGRRNDLGLYATIDYSGLAALDLLAGARLGAFSRQVVSNGVFREKSQLAPAFFLGVTRKIKDSFTLFFNVGTAFRMPSLSEAFYTGISGRNTIVGNPELEPESSLNLDAGLKIHRKNMFAGVYLFQCSIRNMIEKFPLGDTAYTYGNIERGRIRGLEMEFQLHFARNIEIFGNAFVYRGRSTVSGQYLNDVPSAKLFLGARLWLGRFWGEWDWLGSVAVRHPGPAESAIPAYDVHDLKAGYYFSNQLSLSLKIANLLNRAYFANADPDIPLAKGLDFSLGLNLNF
jgi:outer membrane receptor protein involved in Fe transport